MGRAGDEQIKDLAVALEMMAGFRPREEEFVPAPHFASRAAFLASQAVFTVFRVGELAKPIHSSSLRDLYMLADERKPDQRPGRQNSFFCSPTLPGAYSWIDAATERLGVVPKEEMPIWMLHCRDSLPLVYHVKSWDRVKESQERFLRGEIGMSERDSAIKDYWASGMPLERWCESGREIIPAHEAEIMVAPIQVVEAVHVDHPEVG